MRNLSPFPYKFEIKEPMKRIKLETVTDLKFQKYICRFNNSLNTPKEWNPLIKVCKKDLICVWMNYKFGPENWDFEDCDFDLYDDGKLYEFWICVKDESLLSLVALQWG